MMKWVEGGVMWGLRVPPLSGKEHTWRECGALSPSLFLSPVWKMKTIRETIIKIAKWVDRSEQSITQSCFELHGKNVLLTAKACITAGTKQMGCLQHIYLQLFKRLWGELWPVQTTQACPSEGRESWLLWDMMRDVGCSEWKQNRSKDCDGYKVSKESSINL